MRISDHFLKSVLFLGEASVPRASAFLVVETDRPPEDCHLVTARHVVEAAGGKGQRLTAHGHATGGGIARSREIEFDEWVRDPESDVAFFPLAGRTLLDDFTASAIEPATFSTDGFVRENDLGPGDEVFTIGLFGLFTGTTSHQPTARFGNIAMMPSDHVPIRNADGSRAQVRGYLVEGRSIGGQSGSPAFVHLPPTRHAGFLSLPRLGPNNQIPPSAMPHLLGLVSGHFDELVRLEAVNASAVANTGIAVVTPASAIIDAIKRWRDTDR